MKKSNSKEMHLSLIPARLHSHHHSTKTAKGYQHHATKKAKKSVAVSSPANSVFKDLISL
ncbi:hypothetical protein [Schleiferia thermophila]|uniref:hypothetical protein n=1 Tax=Schleiferia thermophila TaxID=884107 RepID=UPI000DF3550A|nr:hypothetical protein [Schleiferia thermophila]